MMSHPSLLVSTGLLLLLISAVNNAAGQCSNHEDGRDLCSEMTVGVHITQEVEEKTALQGELITFTCEAEGSGQLFLQWNVSTEDDGIFPDEQMWVETSQISDGISSNLTLRALFDATIHCEVIQMLEEQELTKVTSTGMLIILWSGQATQPIPSQLTTVWATPTPLITGEETDAMLPISVIVSIFASFSVITVLVILSISAIMWWKHKCKKRGNYRCHVLSSKQASNTVNIELQEPANPEDNFVYSQPDVEKCYTQEADYTSNSYTSYAYPRIYPKLTCIPAIASRICQDQQGWPLNSSTASRRNSCESNDYAPYITSQSESTTDSAYHSVVTESLTSRGALSPCELYHGQPSMYHCVPPIRCEKHQQESAFAFRDFTRSSLSLSLGSTPLEHLDIPNCTKLGCPCQIERSSYYDSLISCSPSHYKNSSHFIHPVTDTRLPWPEHSLRYCSEDTGICMSDLKVLHPVELCTPLSVSSIPFMNHVEVITCDSSGGVYYNPVHDFTLKIPVGAIPEGMSISIEIGVTLYGPFQFPGEMKPVSPIVWLCVQEPHSVQFQKSVEVTLPHYLNISSHKESESMKLSFLTASHNIKPNDGYCFKPAQGQTNFEKQKSYATLNTNHFCFLCIAAKLTIECTKKANYCMITVQPETTQRSSWIIYFCVAYFLQTCIEAVREQFMSGHRITVKKFKFSPAEQDANLQIDFQRAIPEGWVLALQSDNKISLVDLDFWGVEMAELELMHKEKMYPPRFTVEVAGGEASRVSSAKIHFKGAQENLDTEIPLNSVCTTENSRALAYAASASSLSIASGPSTTPPHYGCYPLMISPGQSRSGWDLTNLPEDYPTDQELEEVTKEIMGKLQHDWSKLQAYLGIPDDVMLEIQCASTVRQRVRNMLKNWRQHGKDCSRLRLADCLNAADQRLHRTAGKLVAGEYLMDSPSSSNRSSSISISSMERTLALTSDASSQSSNEQVQTFV